MKNKKIFLSAIIVPVFALSSYAGADFDTTNNQTREQIKTIMEKQKSGEILTADEQELLTNMEANRKEFSGSGMTMGGRGSQMGQKFSEMTDEQKGQMEEMRTLMDKKKSGENLTKEEQEKLTQFEANRPTKDADNELTNQKQTTQNEKTIRNTSNVNTAYKTQIDKKIKNISAQFTTSDEKITGLEKFSKKVVTLQTQINNSSTFSDTKKQTYNEILSSFLTLIQQEIDTLNSQQSSNTDVNQLLESLLN